MNRWYLLLLLFSLFSTRFQGQNNSSIILNEKDILRETFGKPLTLKDGKFYCDGEIYINGVYAEDFYLHPLKGQTKLENGDVLVEYSFPSEVYKEQFVYYKCTLELKFMDGKFFYKAYNPEVLFLNNILFNRSLSFNDDIKVLNPKKKKYKVYLAEFHDLLIDNLMSLYKSLENTNYLNSFSNMKILGRSGAISSALGFYYDKLKDEWFSSKNEIESSDKTLDSFQDFKFWKVEYESKIWYALILRVREGYYKYPNIEVGWTSSISTFFYLFSEYDYNKIKEQPADYLQSYNYGSLYNENHRVRDLLSEMKKSINSGKSLLSKEFRFKKENGKIRFLLPSNFSLDLDNSFYEVEESVFNNLIIK